MTLAITVINASTSALVVETVLPTVVNVTLVMSVHIVTLSALVMVTVPILSVFALRNGKEPFVRFLSVQMIVQDMEFVIASCLNVPANQDGVVLTAAYLTVLVNRVALDEVSVQK